MRAAAVFVPYVILAVLPAGPAGAGGLMISVASSSSSMVLRASSSACWKASAARRPSPVRATPCTRRGRRAGRT